jgi:predicted HicB family RNase H-like nuclease
MKNIMEYKGYYGKVEYSDEDKLFCGYLLGITDMITYEGSSVKELRADFTEAVDDYLATCSQLGKTPQKAYKGTFNVRISPDLHRKAAIYAITHGKTLNAFVEEAIQQEVQKQ